MQTFLSVADGIVAWKKADNGSTPDGYLLNAEYLQLAGTTPAIGIRLPSAVWAFRIMQPATWR